MTTTGKEFNESLARTLEKGDGQFVENLVRDLRLHGRDFANLARSFNAEKATAGMACLSSRRFGDTKVHWLSVSLPNGRYLGIEFSCKWPPRVRLVDKHGNAVVSANLEIADHELDDWIAAVFAASHTVLQLEAAARWGDPT
jgi:hypothetical protein